MFLMIVLLIKFSILAQNAYEKESKYWQLRVSGTEASFRGLSIVDEKTVWISGSKGTVLQTTNGGLNWIKIKVPDADNLDFRDIEALDKNNIILLPAGNIGKIFRTTDGGKNWSIVYDNNDKGIFFDGMAFWEASGMAFSDPINDNFLIVRTDDGGKSWKEIDKNVLPKPLKGEAAFAASGTSVCTFGKSTIWIGLGGASESRIMRSIDKGKSWEIFSTPIASGAPSKGIFSVAFRTEKDGIIVGGDYSKSQDAEKNCAITTNGGKSWQLIENNNPKGFKSCVAFIPATRSKVVITVGTSGSDISYDYGKTWKYIGKTSFNTVAFKKNFGWAIGDKGRIAKFIGKVK